MPPPLLLLRRLCTLPMPSFLFPRTSFPPLMMAITTRGLSGQGKKRSLGPRNSKSYDWYSLALKEEEEAKTKQAVTLNSLLPPTRSTRTRVFMDLKHEEKQLGRITFTLLNDWVPHTCARFEELATTPTRGYLNSHLPRIIKNVAIIGDIIPSLDYPPPPPLKDEAFVMSHGAAGVLSMMTAGIDTCSSAFFVTLSPQTQADGKCVPFGFVDSGLDVLNKTATVLAFKQKPLTPIVIESCGVLKV